MPNVSELFQPRPKPRLDNRVEAFTEAQRLLTGTDASTDDTIAVADWLLTGRCDVALRFAQHTASYYAKEL